MKRIIHQHVTLKRMRVCRLIFNSVSKVIRDCIDFALLRSVIGPENSRHSRNQSDAKTKTDLVTFVFPRFRQFCRLYFEFPYWLGKVFSFLPIGCCDYFGFGYETLNRKACLLVIIKECLILFVKRMPWNY